MNLKQVIIELNEAADLAADEGMSDRLIDELESIIRKLEIIEKENE